MTTSNIKNLTYNEDLPVLSYFSISTEDEVIKLSANFDIKNKYFYLPYLELKISDNEVYTWDNTDFLFGELLPDIKNVTLSNYSDKEKLFFLKHRDVLIYLLESGVQLGWDKI